jgi:probable HAF family extracellular repeat protein
MNKDGIVVGLATAAGAAEAHAVSWDSSGIVDLGTLPGGSCSEALGINSACLIVGYSCFAPRGHHPFIRGGRMLDLEDLVDDKLYWITSVNGIDDAGDIVATGIHSDYTARRSAPTRALLLKPQ